MASRIEKHGNLPSPSRLLHEIDVHARANAQVAKNTALAIARSDAPGSFGATNIVGSVRKSPHGYVVVIQVRAKVRWRAVFVEGGTGIFGPKGKPIRRKARGLSGRRKPFVLPSGARVKEIPGQRPQRFMAKKRQPAAAAALRVLRTGGQAAARKRF